MRSPYRDPPPKGKGLVVGRPCDFLIPRQPKQDLPEILSLNDRNPAISLEIRSKKGIWAGTGQSYLLPGLWANKTAQGARENPIWEQKIRGGRTFRQGFV